MFEKTTTGEWVVLGLSILFGIMSGTNFVVLFIISLIGLYLIYRFITNVLPKSQNWGIILWILVLVGFSVIALLIAVIGGTLITGVQGSTAQSEHYSNYGISFNYPSTIPINSSATGYSNATYYKGALTFDNPEHQGILVNWFPLGSQLDQGSAQNVFTLLDNGIRKNNPDYSMSSLQQTTHSGYTIYYVTGEGHDTSLNGKLGYNVLAIWEDSPSQRDFLIVTSSYSSPEDAQSLFNGVLNSFEGH